MKKITRRIQRPFLEKYATNEMVLEIGGGRKVTTKICNDYFPNRHTVDIDPNTEPDTVADVHNLPFEDRSYNYIVCTEVLEHLHDPKKGVAELMRVLKPGGTLILTTRFIYPFHEAPHDYFRYTESGMKSLFKDWEIVELVPETRTFSTVAALLQRISYQCDLRGGKISKAILLFFILLFDNIDFLVKNEYANIRRTQKVDSIMTTGFYLCAKTKS